MSSPLQMLPAAWSRSSGTTYARLWQGFMTARVILALAIVALQVLAYAMGQSSSQLFLGLCTGYLVATLLMRWLARPDTIHGTLGAQWLPTIGLDLLAFSALQVLQSGSFNYTPLFGLPLLLASVLGSLLAALGTAAAITLLLLADAWWLAQTLPGDSAPRFLQAGLTGTGYFLLAFLMHQLASRLAREEQLAVRNELAATVQGQVNELVIETLGDGVLVVDSDGTVRAANPSARALLGADSPVAAPPFPLASNPAWLGLQELARLTFAGDRGRRSNLSIDHTGQSPRTLHVTTRLTDHSTGKAPGLCVMFMHDLREMEARLRTEKLAAMGRMSAAVAHEIRNPLAAITQANALLEEDLTDPGHQRLTQMVAQNARRLARITEEVLDIARVRHQIDHVSDQLLRLDESVATLFQDWSQTTHAAPFARTFLQAAEAEVAFDPDHLRRVLVNLLDNALRYIGKHPDSLQISTGISTTGQVGLQVWSDGAPLEKTVEQHLFEPFFSSESRSSGLGLYICRELCERHGATISYQRVPRHTGRGLVQGNAFVVAFRAQRPVAGVDDALDTPLV